MRNYRGASLSEFLVIGSVVVAMAIFGATLFGTSLQSQLSIVGAELSGDDPAETVVTTDDTRSSFDNGDVIDDSPGLAESATDKVIDFGKGFLAGLVSQATDIWNIFRHPVEFGKQIIDLGIALATDPVGVLTAILEDLGEDAEAIFSGDTYAAGRVLGENVNPAVIARALSKLADFGGLARVTPTGRFPCSSFIAGTKVWTPQGLQPIEVLRVGGVVETRNDESYQDRAQLVEDTFGRRAPRYLLLSIGNDTIGVTPEHPFWVQGKGWMLASQLGMGSRISTFHGEVLVWSVESVDEPVDVYNMTIARDHSYFVGTAGLWAHNSSNPGGPCNIPVPNNLSRSQLGDLLGSGGNKDVFAYGDSQAIGVLKPGKNPALLTEELALLNKLDEHGLPTVNARGPIDVDGNPALVFDRFAQGSKEIVRLDRGKVRIVGESSLLNQRSIDDLRSIRNTLIDQKIKVNDLQFLIADNGRIVIADPLDVVVGASPSRNNLRTIDLLIEAAEGNS